LYKEAVSVSRSHWDARTHGGYLGHWLIVQILKRLGARAAYACAWPVAAFFTLFARAERNASQQYLERVLGPTHFCGRWQRTFRHLLAFGHAYLDGLILGVEGPRAFTFEHEGTEHLARIFEAGHGGVMLTAHLGTWELASAMLEPTHQTGRIAVVMFRSDAEQLQRFIESLHGRRPRVIAVGAQDLAALEIIRAVRNGELVAMQGDRTVDTRDIEVPFFGRPARWPIGPWIIAAVTGAPLLWAFSLPVGPRRYKFVASAPITVRFVPGRDRNAQLREWIEGYVAAVEDVLRAQPYQWFNFFDFWAAQPKVPLMAGTPSRADQGTAPI
jgi:predicted LPLAT superfamily acyltransferase